MSFIHICISCCSFCSITNSYLPFSTPWTPDFLVLHYLLELAQTHVHWVGDAIQSSCPLLPPSLSAFNLSQHQGFFPMSQLFASGGQSIGVSASASVLPVNIHDWFPLGLIGWISLQSKRFSRVFSNFTKMQICGTILDLLGQNIWVMGLGGNFEK